MHISECEHAKLFWFQTRVLVSYHIDASAVCAVYPAVLQFANLHRAGAAYVSLASAVYWNIACRQEGASRGC